MDWARQFYIRQEQWSGIYTGDVAEEHRRRAAAIGRLAGGGPKRVLELGAGGGQAAAAAADLGHTVVALDLARAALACARRLAAQRPAGALTVVEGDFYTVELAGPFDVVCYWDGFGIGEDDDQRRLLRRIAGWLAPGGRALIDINTPWYWAGAAGRKMQVGQALRRYDFDAEGCRLLDTWWPLDDPAQEVTQSLRCYGPADLRLLLEGTGLALGAVEPGGALVGTQYVERAPLRQAMSYVAVLAREDSMFQDERR
jgi:SAM-dependent methyltransferase